MDDFKIVKSYQSLAKILPDCDRLPISGSPEAKNCIKIGVPGKLTNFIFILFWFLCSQLVSLIWMRKSSDDN